ncbi:MAG: hypothetical protein AAFQ94_19845 [Bacteroidota bacterium]
MNHWNAIIFKTGLTMLFISCLFNNLSGQNIKKEKMAELSFMIGDWIGTSTSYSDGSITQQGPAFEKIAYKLDGELITVDLHSTSLQLHTVIYYEPQDETYYYCSFSKRRAGKFRGEVKDGKFWVWFSDTYRLVFQQTPEGEFMEYGETLKDGKWSKSFKDVLTKAP